MPTRADPPPVPPRTVLALGRRLFLLGTSHLALLALGLGAACTPAIGTGELPFDDGTFFSDGTGWVA